jgi:ATP-binding cassette subfamily C protein
MNKGKETWTLFAAYSRVLLATSAKELLLAGVLAIALGLTDAVTAVLLLPLLAATGVDIGQGGLGKLADVVRIGFATLHLTPTLGISLAVYVLATSAQSALTRWRSVTSVRAEHTFVVALRKRLYASIAGAKWLFISRRRAADLGHVLTDEIAKIGTVTYEVLGLATGLFIVGVYAALALRISVPISLAVIVCGIAMFGILGPQIFKAQREGHTLSAATNRLYTAVIEHIAGLKTAKSYGAEQRLVDNVAQISEELATAEQRAIEGYAFSQFWFDTGSVAALAALIYIGLRGLGLSPAAVLVLVYLFSRIMPRIAALQRGLQFVAHKLPSYAAIATLQSQLDAEQEERTPVGGEIALRHRIQVRHVTFRYGPAAAAVEDLSLDIPRGSLTAIVGPSGSGKSTLADLLIGLLQPDQGQILIDERLLDGNLIPGWKQEIGYVAQDTFIFHDTVRANLLWANPAATADDLIAALHLAEAQFILDFPDGLETILGDRGVRLSGGERQRLALARALLRQPRLLILDEATSALDSENEHRVLDAIERLRGRVTTVIITHRLSAVRRADVIHVIENGRLVESGDWETLQARPSGRFRALSDGQLRETTV